jgi:hypothetical protein
LVLCLPDRFAGQLDDEQLPKIVKGGWIGPEDDSD